MPKNYNVGGMQIELLSIQGVKFQGKPVVMCASKIDFPRPVKFAEYQRRPQIVNADRHDADFYYVTRDILNRMKGGKA